MNDSNDNNTKGSRRIAPALAEKLALIPDRPGVYVFKSSTGQIIYIGKAKSLRSRVRSYFTSPDDGRYQYPRLVASIRDLDLILTTSEVEALKTEADLIRYHKPRFNVDLRDDKSFPFIKITREPFPRVLLTRKPQEAPPGDIYGPFTDVKGTRSLLRTLKGILQIRDCSLPLTPEKIANGKFRLCLDYHIGRCGGPCEGKIAAEAYLQNVRRFVRILKGHNEETIAELETEMKEFSATLRFEDAAFARDRIVAARRFAERQPKVVPNPIDCDAVGMVREDSYAAISVIKVRHGRIIGQSPFHMDRTTGLDESAVLEAFLIRFYEISDSIPDTILLSAELSDAAPMIAYLSDLAGRKVGVLCPQRGEKKHLIEIAHTNAEHLLLENRVMADKRDFVPRSITALQESLNLSTPPQRIDAFDISHLAGSDTVASMVVFKDGKPLKSAYRIFKIRTVEGIDDFSSIGEAVERRYSRLLMEKANVADIDQDDSSLEENATEEKAPKDNSFPDLVLIDGGIGQLNRARQVLDRLGLPELPVVGLAKRLEEIYIPGESEPLLLSRSSSALRLLQQLRDEAHRFAITRQRLLRGKRQVKSRLDAIEGVGPSRRGMLLNHFGSVKRIAAASLEELIAVPGMNKRLAEVIKTALHDGKA